MSTDEGGWGKLAPLDPRSSRTSSFPSTKELETRFLRPSELNVKTHSTQSCGPAKWEIFSHVQEREDNLYLAKCSSGLVHRRLFVVVCLAYSSHQPRALLDMVCLCFKFNILLSLIVLTPKKDYQILKSYFHAYQAVESRC